MADGTPRPGDAGTSTLLDGTRLPKDHPVFEALGALDELTAALGVVRAELGASGDSSDAERIRAAQRVLVRLGTELATPAGSAAPRHAEGVTDADCAELERFARELEARAPRPRGFVLPGATPLEALVHVARAAARTAERRAVSCARGEPGRLELACRYLNRLSGCLFWLALCHGAEAAD